MPSVLFLFLKAFVATGGIEKVNRTLLRVLFDLHQNEVVRVRVASPYAIQPDERYFPAALLEGYRGKRWRFMLDILFGNWKADVLLVGHVNLAPAVWLLKKKYPHIRILVIAHGIEVWAPLSGLKRWLVQTATKIIAVSQFTAHKLETVQGVDPKHIVVLPNCLDPFFEFPARFDKPEYLLRRYGLNTAQPVILTVSRLNAQEGYKGYDKVLNALPGLLSDFPDLQYILAGKSDKAERQRIRKIIRDLGLESRVHLTGFLPDKELNDHYRLANVFVMPSKKEGFGLVFIEALGCGTPVIAGNADGSTEALRGGQLGMLVDPDDPNAIAAAVKTALTDPGDPAARQKAVAREFAYPEYKSRLETLILSPGYMTRNHA